ncbi:MAG: NAD(P)/FAD-dependent oxidoreductase [Caldimonas sp.]
MSPALPAPPIETDALIIGAGPVGLFQVFELGLLEIRAHVVDSLPHTGGQCVELYADKPIYDIPALPFCTGRELVERLEQQIAPFGAIFHLGQQVSALAPRGDGRFDVETSSGTRFITGAVVIAGGVGSFQPRRLKLDGLDRFAGKQAFDRLPESADLAGRRVVVVGAGETAVAAALAAAGDGTGDDARMGDSAARPLPATSVTLVHRRDEFDAAPEKLAALRAARAAGRIAFVGGVPNAIAVEGDSLAGLVVACNDGTTRTIGLDTLLVLLGWSPKLGPIAEWGLALERKQLVVDTERFETSAPGIHAVGDVNTYPGKKKLIVSGFHEATLAAFAIAARLHPDRAQPLQYTTTSPKLHRLLGVAPVVANAKAHEDTP